MTHRLSALLTLACIWLSTSALAQDVVGTSVLGGKRVELLSDNTWRFVEVPEADGRCVPINTKLSFCGTIFDWRPKRTAGTDFTRVFSHSDVIAAGIIHEEIGAADGMDLAFMRNRVIENAADVTGMRPEEIVISEVQDVMVGDYPGEMIAYEVTMDGLEIRYRNTIISTDNHTFQLVAWNVGKTRAENFSEVAQSFLDATRITLPEGDK